jgi:hypothetical protein
MSFVEGYFNITMLDIPMAIGNKCFACQEDFETADLFAVGVYMPKQRTLYFHDMGCFDQFLSGLNQFDMLRPTMRSGPERVN